MYFLIFVVSQVVAVTIIVLVLKVTLDHMLIDLAVRHIECWKLTGAKVEKIHLTTHKPLSTKYQVRFEKACKKILPPDKTVQYGINPGIQGGAILVVDDQKVDCSVRERIHQAIRMR